VPRGPWLARRQGSFLACRLARPPRPLRRLGSYLASPPRGGIVPPARPRSRRHPCRRGRFAPFSARRFRVGRAGTIFPSRLDPDGSGLVSAERRASPSARPTARRTNPEARNQSRPKEGQRTLCVCVTRSSAHRSRAGRAQALPAKRQAPGVGRLALGQGGGGAPRDQRKSTRQKNSTRIDPGR